jgi:hypothetical protein
MPMTSFSLASTCSGIASIRLFLTLDVLLEAAIAWFPSRSATLIQAPLLCRRAELSNK